MTPDPTDERPLPAAPPEAAGATADPAGPGPLGRRFLRPETLVSFVAALAILAFFFRRFQIDPAAVWAQIRQANPLWLAMAYVAWYGGFWLRAARWREMLASADVDAAHGYRVPPLNGLVEILTLGWFANCVVPAKLGDAYRGFLLRQEGGVPFSKGIGTIIAERLADLVILFAMMAAVGMAIFRGRIPTEATQTFTLGAVLIALAAIALAVMWAARDTLHRLVPERFRDQYANLHDAVFRSMRRPLWVVVPGVLLWLIEGLRFWFVATALHSGMPFAVALFVALMGSLLTTLPLTPAGLGVLEAGTGAVLIHVFGMSSSLAVSIILLDRVVAYWSLIVIGLVLYVLRFRRIAAEPAAAPAPAATRLGQAD